MKSWLIRTTNNIILGPVSEKKLKVLIKKGSLEENDEICSGNGYWIFLREKELVNKYLYRGCEQGFNPIYHEPTEPEVDENISTDRDKTDEFQIVRFQKEDGSQDIAFADTEADVIENTVEESELKGEVPKVASAFSEIFTGNFLKLVAAIIIVLALILLYFRKVILSGIFS